MDRALSVAAWHHLDDPQRASDELARTLRPGTRVVVIDLAIVQDEDAVAGLKGHDRAFNADGLQSIFERCGLVGIEVERVGRWVVGVAHKPQGGEA